MHLVQSKSKTFDLKVVREQLGGDWEAVNREIIEQLSSDVALVNSVSHYIISSGGKRLRPLLLLLSARACGYQGSQHITAAAIIEFIHTATLLHDDVVDASDLRRGQHTANSVFGAEASVLVGDFLYSRAFQLMVDVGQMRIMDVLADATNTIAEGEVLQLMNCRNPETTEDQCVEVIYRKTAKLFEAGVVIGALLADQTRAVEDAFIEYGKQLGTAFQLVDDALDYDSSHNKFGKNVGDDLAEGKPTLPLIHALHHSNASDQVMIREAIENGGLDQIDAIIKAVKSCGAIAYTMQLAQQAADRAIDALSRVPNSNYKNSLIDLAQFAAERRY
ncbi:MAG: octaprenyl diphosphate synthase [Gammaproteobacteria bacterium]|jgi:octaprenyl-diphosphate synthase|nr:octaprenyl diphosphate synthase [Chromatiales bacterium]MDP6673643.1 octaprenyl diphosphate synthase [Gammaproteobacteria bacterium]